MRRVEDELLVSIICAMALVVGLVGTLLPIVPGVPLMWFASFLYGVVVGYSPFGVVVMSVLTVLLALSLALGFVVPRKAAQATGARTRSQVVGVIFAVVGFFLIPVVGAVVGALVGVLVAEYFDKGSLPLAWSSTVAIAKGFGVGALLQFGVGFAMLLVWSTWAAVVVF